MKVAQNEVTNVIFVNRVFTLHELIID